MTCHYDLRLKKNVVKLAPVITTLAHKWKSEFYSHVYMGLSETIKILWAWLEIRKEYKKEKHKTTTKKSRKIFKQKLANSWAMRCGMDSDRYFEVLSFSLIDLLPSCPTYHWKSGFESPTIFVEFSICLFSSVRFCFIYFGFLLLGAYTVYFPDGITLLWLWNFPLYL